MCFRLSVARPASARRMPTGRTSSGGFVGDQLANLIGLPELQGGPLESCSAVQLFRRFAGRLGHVNKAHQGLGLQCTDYPCTVQWPREPECSTKRFFVHRGFQMRLCRFGKNRLGLVRANSVIDVMPVLDRLPSYRYPLPRHDQRRTAPEGEYPRSDHRCAGAHRLRDELLYLTGTPEGVGPSEGATSYDRQSPASVK
jgi:hypothetical protein